MGRPEPHSWTYSSTPTHFPAEKAGLVPDHRTCPIPEETWTFAPIGASGVVISALGTSLDLPASVESLLRGTRVVSCVKEYV